MQKTKEKCCADCKYCIRHDISDYECGKTGRRNRITGRYEYRKCAYVIDSPECEFEDNTKQRVAMFIITLVIAIGAAFFAGWNIL